MYNVEPIKTNRLKLLVIMDIGYYKKNNNNPLHADGHSNSKVSQTANVNHITWKDKRGFCEESPETNAASLSSKQLFSAVT